MEATVRLLNSTHPLKRHLPLHIKTTRLHRHSLKLCSNANPTFPGGRSIRTLPCASLSSSRSSNAPLSLPSLSLSQIFSPPSSHLDRSDYSVANGKQQQCDARDRSIQDIDGGNLGFYRENGPGLKVVLLGWLGAEQRHLKRYSDLYSSRGIPAVGFVVPVRDLLGFDLGRRVEGRIAALVEDLIGWLSETEKDGRERGLLFHTFSNTGWLAYGAILDNLQQRGADFMKKIKGCVIDSGADPDINPKVWAEGFSAALLKKRSTSANSSPETTGGGPFTCNDSSLLEMVLLGILEKFFSKLLKLPDVNWRLSKIISILSNDQPPCPQLYLYSTADKVIPSRSVEYFIHEQKKSGRNVWGHNFGSSPHVDHLRSFPDIYSEKLQQFLEDCIPKVGQM